MKQSIPRLTGNERETTILTNEADDFHEVYTIDSVQKIEDEAMLGDIWISAI